MDTDIHASRKHRPSARRNTQAACNACRTRKKRCDGVKPICGLCATFNTDCLWSERKTRGPARNKNYIAQLEERLQKVETTISATTTDAPIIISNVERATPQPSRDTPANYSESFIAQPSIPKLFPEVADTGSIVRGIEARSNNDPFPRTIFVPLPPQHRILRLLHATWDDLSAHSLLMDLENVIGLVTEQFATAGAEGYGDNPARWALINALAATCLLHKATHEFLEKAARSSWDFFKNSFAVFPELVTQGSDLLACEALLAMALFTRASGDARTTTQLSATASRIVYTIGLQKKENIEHMEPSIAARARRVYWMAFILDAEMTHRYGLPLAMGDVQEHAQCLQHSSGDPRLIPLECIARLSLIQSRVDETLHSAKTLLLGTRVLSVVSDLHAELKAWKEALPPALQLAVTQNVELSDNGQAILYFTYLSIKIKVSMLIARLRKPNPTTAGQVMAFESQEATRTIERSWESCISFARETIQVMLSLTTDCLPALWEMMAYPIAAFMLLVQATAQLPRDCHADENLEALMAFMAFLRKLQDAGADIGNLLQFCTNLHRVSAATDDTNLGVVQNLSTVDDCLHLAGGLMSNMSLLGLHAHRLLGPILSPGGVYGQCVPTILKADQQGFTFGS